MPSYGQAFAGAAPPPVDISRTKSKETASKIMITVPSPTIGALNDDLILQMVGAEPLRKQNKQIIELAALGYLSSKEDGVV
jgi:hypothetical protein